MRKFFTFYCVLALLSGYNVSDAQTRKQTYDSALVGDRITPAVSSVMMPKTYTEVLLNNALITTNSFYGGNRNEFKQDYRSTYLINTLQITHGISASGRLNVGVDLSYSTGRQDADRESSALKVFGNDSDNLREYSRGFTSVGVRARYAVTKNRNFVIQHTLSFPMNNKFLVDSRPAFNTQLFYTHLLGRKIFLFGQADVIVRFVNGEADSQYSNNLNIFGTYLLTKNLFPFIQIGTTNVWGDDLSHMAQSYTYGMGLQYQFSTMFTINAFYNDVFAGKNYSNWTAVSVGVRAVF